MAVIQPYEQRYSAQGAMSTTATGDAFGAQIGRANSAIGESGVAISNSISNVGHGISNIAEAQDKIQQDQGQIWGYKETSSAFTALKTEFDNNVKALDPTEPDFETKLNGLADAFKQKIGETTSDLLSRSPSKSAQRVVSEHMATNEKFLMGHAASELASASKAYAEVQLTASTKEDQDSISVDPSNANLERVLENRRRLIGSMNLDPDTKIKWWEKTQHSLALTQVSVQAATDPDFLTKINAHGGRIGLNGATKGAVPGGTAGTRSAPSVFSNPDAVWRGMIGQESGGKQFTNGKTTESPKGALGIAQIMPTTGPEAAKLAGLPWDEKRFKEDAAYNEALGRAYFDKQLKTFGGDMTKAMAAYNMGPGRTQSLIAKYGDEWLAHAPKETRQYVASITQKLNATASKGVQLASADNGVVSDAGNGFPQVEALSDADILSAKPAIAGWNKLTWGEKMTVVRQAEAIRGAALAGERAEITKALPDIVQSRLAGKDYPGMDGARFSKDNLVRVLGQDVGTRAFDQIKYADSVGVFVTQMNTMPAAQAAAYLKSLEPQGGPEFATKNPVYQQAVNAMQQVVKARNKDYIAWAQSTPGTNVKPLDLSNPDKFRASFAARIPAAIAGRQDYNADSHMLSEDEAAALGDMLNRLNPQDQMTYLGKMREATVGHDNWFLDALGQIAPKNTMLGFAAVTGTRQGNVQTDAGPQNGAIVGQYILEGAHILQGKDLNDPTKSGKPFVLDEKLLRESFWNKLGTNAFASPDASRSAQMAEDTYQAVKNYMVADMYRRGLPPGQFSPKLMENAINAVTGGTTKVNGNVMFLPWGMPEKQFNTQFPLALDAALTRSGIKGTQLDAPDGYQYRNVGDGKYQITHGNKALVGTDGRSVIIDINQPYAYSGTPDAIIRKMGR